jgi:hypothetical protein
MNNIMNHFDEFIKNSDLDELQVLHYTLCLRMSRCNWQESFKENTAIIRSNLERQWKLFASCNDARDKGPLYDQPWHQIDVLNSCEYCFDVLYHDIDLLIAMIEKMDYIECGELTEFIKNVNLFVYGVESSSFKIDNVMVLQKELGYAARRWSELKQSYRKYMQLINPFC